MSENEAFIAAIAAAPEDDTPRLVYADFLEEHGDDARAGFIRDQVRLAKLRPGGDEYRQLFRRTAETLKANLPAWIQTACEAFGQPTTWKPAPSPPRRLAVELTQPPGVYELLPLSQLDFVRGFPDRASIQPRSLTGSGPLEALLRQHPITRLQFCFPVNLEGWRRVVVPALGQIRTLHLYGRTAEDAYDAIYGDPVWSGLSRLSLWSLRPELLERLCASPLAKRLHGLRVTFGGVTLAHLHLFPVDDRLVEFGFDNHHPGLAKSLEGWDRLSAATFRPTLKRLDLTGCTIGDRGLATFARGDVWVRLRALVLDRNRFGDPGWRDFVRSRRTPELTLLSASRNFVTGDGAGRLAQSPLAATLEYVDLRGNRIDGKGAVALARAFGDGPLKKLLLAGNPIPPRDAETVRKILGERVAV